MNLTYNPFKDLGKDFKITKEQSNKQEENENSIIEATESIIQKNNFSAPGTVDQELQKIFENRPKLKSVYTKKGGIIDRNRLTGKEDIIYGESADDNELNLHKGKLFAPENPLEAEKYFLKRINQITDKYIVDDKSDNTALKSDVDLIDYYNKKLLSLYSKNPDQQFIRQGRNFNKLNTKNEKEYQRQIVEMLSVGALEEIRSAEIWQSSKDDEELFGISFIIRIDTIMQDNDRIDCRFSFENKNDNKTYIGNISIDAKNGNVQFNALPSLSETDLDNKVYKKLQAHIDLNTREFILQCLASLIKQNINVYHQKTGINKPDNQIAADKISPQEIRPIEDKLKNFRRRIIESANEAWVKVFEMVNGISDQELNELKLKRNDLIINIYSTKYALEEQFRQQSDNNIEYCPTLQTYLYKDKTAQVGSCIYSEATRAYIEELSEIALRKGDKAVAAIEQFFIPPLLRGEESGKSPRPHARKGNILVIGREYFVDFSLNELISGDFPAHEIERFKNDNGINNANSGELKAFLVKLWKNKHRKNNQEQTLTPIEDKILVRFADKFGISYASEYKQIGDMLQDINIMEKQRKTSKM